MLLLLCAVIFTIGCFQSEAAAVKSAPQFADNFFVKGLLILPYAEINEPFKAFYDKRNGRSRIDYYGEIVQTYQLAVDGEFGSSYKVAYMPDETGLPTQTCFQVNGTKDNPVSIQSILPDLTNFNYERDAPCFQENPIVWDDPRQGQMCELWVQKNTVEDKTNKYSMYLDKKTGAPVHYIMKGYNTLLGSHYDKYELYYVNYTVNNVTDGDFDINSRMQCTNFPGPGVEELVLNNPMREFINNEDGHIHRSFDDFKTKHEKTYKDNNEQESRKNIYRQNYRYIQSMNRKGLTYSLEVNHLADYTDMELHRIRGRLPSQGYNGGQPFPKEKFPTDLPENLDWRLYGVVTPVKDQAVCGSCWSFGTTGTIEGTYAIKTNKLVRLSQQQLIDCSWRFQNNGCDGGEDFRAYAYIMAAGGLAAEEDYGQYLGSDGLCHDHEVDKVAQISGFVNVTSGDLQALKQAIAKQGPISVSIDAAHKSFSFYSHGVFYEPDCKNGEDQLDHSVLAVGYGVMNGHPYWLVKNSWSTYWGNDGYVLMSQKDNNCGVATSPTYVLM
ncbi:digestive cysteine proteinase 2-like [Uloborus diversus]|uniref:digestive cysteine proteinase 2-like n=1 Tax=Uloborus diversus TaxID=327109 RepID=UPI002409F0F6|nr:digestive cysteine proteinase 2-like [Uloborus diversus]